MKRALQFALALVLAIALQGVSMAQTATVMTDQADYAPGTIVTITGSGWQPGETVTLSLVESPLIDTHPDLYATADANGNIINNQFSPDEHDINISFTLTATGQLSGLVAQTTFTDATNLKTVTVGAQGPATITPGGTATFTVQVAFNGNGTCTASLSITTTLPTGANPTFSPNSVTATATTSVNSTLTVTTTNSTPAGTYSFTVQATGTAGDCVAGTASGTGSLVVVAGLASKLVFTNAPVTVAAGACSSSLTIQSQDANGNASNVTSTETLSPSGPAGATFYTDNTCTTSVTASNLTIPSGSNAVTLFFQDTNTGPINITVNGSGAFTANGQNAAKQTETVTPAVARRGQTIVAGLFVDQREALAFASGIRSFARTGRGLVRPWEAQSFATSVKENISLESSDVSGSICGA